MTQNLKIFPVSYLLIFTWREENVIERETYECRSNGTNFFIKLFFFKNSCMKCTIHEIQINLINIEEDKFKTSDVTVEGG